jgi:hypothetical protein
VVFDWIKSITSGMSLSLITLLVVRQTKWDSLDEWQHEGYAMLSSVGLVKRYECTNESHKALFVSLKFGF